MASASRRYRAFISYSTHDRAAGERFQRAIERYRIPKPLRGTDYGHGPVGTRLTPLFRDRSDADASVSLAATLRTALEQSDALVVLCSPASAASHWVNEEIRTFKSLGRGLRVFPVLVDGTPRRYDPETAPEGAFPPALFERVDASGQVLASDEPEPLAPDIRETGDGFHAATLKVVAALTGISLTTLSQREREAERRDRRIVVGIAVSMTILAAAAVVSAITAWRAAEDARAQLGNAIEIAERRVDDAARFHDTFGVPIAVIQQLLGNAERDFDAIAGEEQTDAPTLRLARGRLLVHLSSLYREVGNSERQLELARRGLETLETVSDVRVAYWPSTWFARLPSHESLVTERLAAFEALGTALGETEAGGQDAVAVLEQGRVLAVREQHLPFVARFWSLIGDQRYLRGDMRGALAASDAAIAALTTAPASSRSSEAVLDLTRAWSDRAELLLESERHQEARQQQAQVVTELETRTASAPDDAALALSLGHAVTRLADMDYAVSGDWAASIPGLERGRAIFERLYAADTSRVDYARDLSVALERIGDVRLQFGDAAAAGPLFERAIALRQERVARDPGNREAARDLAVGLERRADVALTDKKPDWALAALDRARELRTQSIGDLATADPVETRDLAVLWSKTGTVRRELTGQDWAAAFEQAIVLMAPLVEIDDAPPGWLRDLAVFRTAYGDALERAGRAADARQQWSEALAAIDRQLQINGSDPRLLEDRRTLRQKLGMRSARLEPSLPLALT